MDGNWLLTFTIASLCIAMMPSLLNKQYRMHPATAFLWMLLLIPAVFGYYINKQYAPFVFQIVGVLQWVWMFIKSVKNEPKHEHNWLTVGKQNKAYFNDFDVDKKYPHHNFTVVKYRCSICSKLKEKRVNDTWTNEELGINDNTVRSK